MEDSGKITQKTTEVSFAAILNEEYAVLCNFSIKLHIINQKYNGRYVY